MSPPWALSVSWSLSPVLPLTRPLIERLAGLLLLPAFNDTTPTARTESLMVMPSVIATAPVSKVVVWPGP